MESSIEEANTTSLVCQSDLQPWMWLPQTLNLNPLLCLKRKKKIFNIRLPSKALFINPQSKIFHTFLEFFSAVTVYFIAFAGMQSTGRLHVAGFPVVLISNVKSWVNNSNTKVIKSASGLSNLVLQPGILLGYSMECCYGLCDLCFIFGCSTCTWRRGLLLHVPSNCYYFFYFLTKMQMQTLQSSCLADVDEEYTYGDVRKCGLK